jgi:hypothetical protein
MAMKQVSDPSKPPAIFPRDIKKLIFEDDMTSNPSRIAQIRSQIDEGDVFLLESAVRREWILKVRDYLIQVGRNSLPNYLPIQKGSPNFHRLNRLDERSYVPACFHQFSFFPWNQDVFELFTRFKGIFQLRNLLNRLNANKFLGREPEEECTARLSFQFYPKGIGQMNKHADPVDFHQTVVPMLLMSQKGKDYVQGGGYIENASGKKLFIEDEAGIGDLVLFHAAIPHGVQIIDPTSPEDWVSFEGRWTLLFAVNKLAENVRVANAQNLG